MELTVAPLALTCFILLGAGYLLFLILGQVKRLSPVIQEAWPILHVETLIVAVVAGSIWIGGWVLALVLLAHAVRVGYEATTTAALRAELPPPLMVGIATAALCVLATLLPLKLMCTFVLIGILLCIGMLKQTAQPDNTTRTITLELLIFPLLPMVIFTGAALQGNMGIWLLIAFILVETFDSYALLGGKLFGKHPAFPKLSPKKTIEGLSIGAASLMITAALVGTLLASIPIWISAAIALYVGSLTVVGDLAASRLKRASGVKDFPVLLPHQGGLLDTTDAWIVAGAGLITLAAFTELT